MYFNSLKPFMKNFLWGASSSAFQIEGAWNEDGKGLSASDKEDGISNFRVASDHYHRYKDDIRLLGEMGLKMYRFSIAWTRIIPDGIGIINPKGIEFYNNLIDECLKYNIEPLITILHFDMPVSLDQAGGWENPAIIDAYLNYCKVLFENFGDRVKYWLTDNEYNMGVMFAAQQRMNDGLNMKEVFQANHHCILAQAKAITLLHEKWPDSKIGPAPNIQCIYPASCKPEDIIAAQDFNVLRNLLPLDLACKGEYNRIAWSILEKEKSLPDIGEDDFEILKNGTPDFIAFNYYESHTVEAYPQGKPLHQKPRPFVFNLKKYWRTVENPYFDYTQFGWQIDEVGFRITLRMLNDRYGLPLIITENGLGAYDKVEEDGKINDDYRIDYLHNHIHQMHIAVDEGVNVFGYCTWTAIDLVSTHEGVNKRYGLIYVNSNNEEDRDLIRTPKKSYSWYKALIERNEE